MTKEEIAIIIAEFNKLKKDSNWFEFANGRRLCLGYNKSVERGIINPKPNYNFKTISEFLYWVRYSEEENFIDTLFCPVCGKLIERITDVHGSISPYSKACCPKHVFLQSVEQRKATNLKVYGNEWSIASSEVRTKINKTVKNRTPEQKEAIDKKRKQTCLENFGNEYAIASDTIKEKIKETNLKNTGYDNPLSCPEIHKKAELSCIKNNGGLGLGSKKIRKKIENTNHERFGCAHISECEEIRNKIKSTNLKNLGVEYPLQNAEIHKKTIDAIKSHDGYAEMQPKIQATKLERYGDAYYTNKEKYYDAISHRTAEDRCKIRMKYMETMRKRGKLGLNVSEWEQSLVDRIREAFPEYTIVQQYKEERYPYLCDCYIKELDLFIEFNGSFYHNYRPFVESVEMIEEYDDMVARSQLLESIANKWRYIDPEKRRIAEMNNLNFIEYWEDSTENIVELIERYTHKNL